MIEYKDLSDEKLIDLLNNGEKSVLDYLMDKYKDLVRHRARTLFLYGGDTDDLIQEGMIGLFKGITSFKIKENASFKTFATLCIDRQMFTAINKSNCQKHQPLNTYVEYDGDNIELSSNLPKDPLILIIEKENEKILKSKINSKLSKMENRVLKLYLEGKSYSEISKSLEVTEKAVDNAIQRIRQKVIKIIK